MRLETASIHYLDDATVYIEVKDGQVVQLSNLDGKSAALPKSCRLALVFDPFGEIEPAEAITIGKGDPQ